MKAGFEARARARKEKEREREEKIKEEQKEAEERDADLGGWSRKLRQEQEARIISSKDEQIINILQALMNRIRDRARRKVALTDRKSAAAQARMKNIANLASDERMSKKKRKIGGGIFVYSALHSFLDMSCRGYLWCR